MWAGDGAGEARALLEAARAEVAALESKAREPTETAWRQALASAEEAVAKGALVAPDLGAAALAQKARAQMALGQVEEAAQSSAKAGEMLQKVGGKADSKLARLVHAPLGPSTLMPGKDMLEKDNGLVTLPEDPVEQEADQIFAQRVAVAKAKVQPTALVRQSSGLLVEASTSLPFQVALRRDQVGAPAQVIARYFRHARSVNTMPIMDLPG
ncbi:unnamed protein product [Effrenium voratum]|uniref:Uncharacterized protein n=1 Tax=Effrenium voratum TaxID=2562239 RepID=A0AA36I7B6_9DINO|nr:unnamed protein product [Effrenium voratum]